MSSRDPMWYCYEVRVLSILLVDLSLIIYRAVPFRDAAFDGQSAVSHHTGDTVVTPNIL